MQRIVMTEAILREGMTPAGGYTEHQLGYIGISWPPARGWKRRVLGASFPAWVVQGFLDPKPPNLTGTSGQQRLF